MPYREEGTITLSLIAKDLMSGQLGKAVAGLDALARKGGLVGAMAQGVGQSFGQLLDPIGLVTSGIGALTGYLGDALAAAADEQAGIERLTTAIRENDAGWKGSIATVEGVIAARERLAFSDGEQRDSLARLVAITKDVNEALRLQRQAMDLARLRGMKLVDAGEVIGKVYGGNIGILSRYGIQLRRGIRPTEALAEVQRMAAGQAQAFADSLAGRQQSLAIALDDLQEDIGGLLTGPATQLVGFLDDLVDAVDGPDGATGALAEMSDAVRQLGKDAQEAMGPAHESWQQFADDIARQERYLTVTMGASVGEWVRGYGVIAEMLGNTTQQLGQVALDYQRAGKTIDQFHQDLVSRLVSEGPQVLADRLGTSLDEVNAMIAARIAAGAPNVQVALTDLMGQLVEGTLAPVRHAVTKAAKELGGAPKVVLDGFRGFVPAVTASLDRVRNKSGRGWHWKVDMHHQLRDLKDDFRTTLAAIDHMLQHPGESGRTKTELERQIDVIERKRRRAARTNNWQAFVAADRKLKELQARLDAIDDTEAQAKVVVTIEGEQRLNRMYHNLQTKHTGYFESEHRAGGGPVSAGRAYVVGEERAEVFVPSTAGTILPSTRGLGATYVYAPGYSTASPAEAQRFMAAIGPEMDRYLSRRF